MLKLDKTKNKFQKDGFVILKKIFSNKEIKKLIKEIKYIKKKSIKIKNPHLHYTKDKKVNTIHNINKYINKGPIIKVTKNKKILKNINHIFNSKSKVRNIEFFLKPKKTGLSSPFHQDNYYWNFSNKEKALNAWVACSNSSYKNGGLCYFKGSQSKGLLKHSISYLPGSSQKIQSNILKRIKTKKVYPNLKMGDCLLHHSEVVHGSGPNKSNNDRIGLVIGYKSEDAKINKKKLNKYKIVLKKNISFLKKNYKKSLNK
jgi:ectoine hydroxylase-related dioxygenase (phytanoyl-CoA dioxygenase family)